MGLLRVLGLPGKKKRDSSIRGGPYAAAANANANRGSRGAKPLKSTPEGFSVDTQGVMRCDACHAGGGRHLRRCKKMKTPPVVPGQFVATRSGNTSKQQRARAKFIKTNPRSTGRKK